MYIKNKKVDRDIIEFLRENPGSSGYKIANALAYEFSICYVKDRLQVLSARNIIRSDVSYAGSVKRFKYFALEFPTDQEAK